MAKTKVLITDDEPDIIVIIKARLEANSFEVITARNGQECLERAKEAPGVILLDIFMPGMDGYEVIKRLAADDATKSIPVIMFSASSGDEAFKKALDAGAASYIVKPFDPKVLIETIRKVVK